MRLGLTLKHTPVLVLAVLLTLTMGIVVLRAASGGPEAETFQACVDSEGNIRLLGEALNGKYSTECKKNEALYEFASGQSITTLRQSQQQLAGSVGALEMRIAVLEAIPTPTPMPTATAIPDSLADYQTILGIFGPTGVVLPLVDLDTGGFGPTFTTVSSGPQQFTFAWSNAFDVPPSVQGSVPVVELNGINESASTLNNRFWSRGDGSTDGPFSVGAWVSLNDTTDWPIILGKFGSTNSTREWYFGVRSGDRPLLVLGDNGNLSQGVVDSGIPLPGAMNLLVATYDGVGGAAAADGITLYVNGSVVASTATNQAGYTAMSNLSVDVNMGQRADGVSYLDGSIAGGPCGPFFTHTELSATEVGDLFDFCQALLALP